MARKAKKTAELDIATMDAIEMEGPIAPKGWTEVEAGLEHINDDLDDEIRVRSVVSSTYKARYRDRAAALPRKPKDIATKALKRCNSDWLAVQLARLALDEKQKLVVSTFEAILDANGVKHDHWNRTTPGWQGRLRMTGRLALQRVVAEREGELALPDGSILKAPKTWVDKTIR